MKEKNATNTKKFMDERKNNMLKQNKKREKQKKTHETELENISKYIHETVEMYNQEEVEMKLAAKQEAYV